MCMQAALLNKVHGFLILQLFKPTGLGKQAQACWGSAVGRQDVDGRGAAGVDWDRG